MKTVNQTIEYFGEEYTYEVYKDGRMVEEGYGWDVDYWSAYTVTNIEIENWGDENAQIIKLYIKL